MPASSSCTDESMNSDILLDNRENIYSLNCNETFLCDPAWLVPLTIHEANVVVTCFITNPGELLYTR